MGLHATNKAAVKINNNFFICFILLAGSWLQTSHWYKYRKSVEPLFAYSFNRGSSKTFDQEQTMNAHADMPIVVKHNEKYIPRGIYRSLALGSKIC